MKNIILSLIVSFALLNACGGNKPVENRTTVDSKTQLIRGQSWFDKGCPVQAMNFFNDAVNQARLVDDPILLIKSQNNLGASLLAQNRLSEASDWLERALELSLSLNEQPELHSVLGNFGVLAYQSNNFQDAEEFWQKAILSTQSENALKRNDNPISHYLNLAQLRLEKGKIEEAKRFLEETNNLVVSSEHRAETFNLKAEIALKENDLNSARNFLQESLKINRQNESTLNLAKNLNSLSLLEISAHNGQKAAVNLDRAFFLWISLGRYDEAKKIHRLLIENKNKFNYPKNINLYQKILSEGQNNNIINPICI